MTMQTTTLPFQVSGATALAQPARNAAAGVQAPNGGQFGATLSREIAQRQAPAAAPAAPSGTAGKPAPAKQQGTEKPAAQGPKTAAREPEKRQEAVSDTPSTASASAGLDTAEGAQDAESASAAATAAAQAAAAPVTDMLAFMASLAQPVVAVATPVIAEAAAPAAAAAGAGAGLQLSALESAFAKLEAVTEVGAGPTLATASEGEQASFALATGMQPATTAAATATETADLRALQQTAQAAVQADPNKLQGQAREAGVHTVAEVEAPAPAVTQLQAAAARLEVANPAAVPADRIPARVGTQAWDNQVSQRIVYMVGKEQAATLTLNPPDLGPVQVVLNVSNEGTSVAFSSNELEVRQALENALPRLREMMSESGIALGNATVDAGTQQQQQARDGERRAHATGGERFGDGPAMAANEAAPRTRTVALGDNGLVDTFA